MNIQVSCGAAEKQTGVALDCREGLKQKESWANLTIVKNCIDQEPWTNLDTTTSDKPNCTWTATIRTKPMSITPVDRIRTLYFTLYINFILIVTCLGVYCETRSHIALATFEQRTSVQTPGRSNSDLRSKIMMNGAWFVFS